MQTVSSKIWIRVVVSISYDDNHYITGISTFEGYFTPNPCYANNHFYFKQFSLAWIHSLIVKNIYISSYSV